MDDASFIKTGREDPAGSFSSFVIDSDFIGKSIIKTPLGWIL